MSASKKQDVAPVERVNPEQVEAMIQALRTVSFYASINHDRCGDYGEVVDPVLKSIGIQTGSLS